MHPELIEIPFIHITVKSYGLMMVIGFLMAVSIIRRLSRDITPDPQMITNAALYSLIGGVVGARLFYVIHYWGHFKGNLGDVFAIWQGGLELIGGVVLAITIIFLYLLYHKLPARQYLDILAIGLMLALVFGRLGCFMNGCCFGKPADSAWAVRFPYDSFAYNSQINADPKRHRDKAYWELPRGEYVGLVADDGKWYPKAKAELTEQQRYEVTRGKYRCLPVHPTQLYSSLAAGLSCLILYAFWRRARKVRQAGQANRLLAKPGQIFALMFILYAAARFGIEFFRDDNPFEYGPWTMHVIYVLYKGGTVSQNLSIYLAIAGVLLLVVLQTARPERGRGD